MTNEDVYLKLIPDEEARAESLRASLEKEILRAEKNTTERLKFFSLHGQTHNNKGRIVFWTEISGYVHQNQPTPPEFRFPSKMDYEVKCLISSTKMNMFELLQHCLIEEQLQSVEHLKSDLMQIEVESNGYDYDNRTEESTPYQFDVFRNRTFDKTPDCYYNDLLSYGKNCQNYINRLIQWNETQESNLMRLYDAVEKHNRAEFERLSEKYGKKETQ